jgi:CRISPR-associated protein Csd1
MTILHALNRLGERLQAQDKLPPFGFSNEKIGFCIGLNEDGSVAAIHDLRTLNRKKLVSRILPVPQSIKRASGVATNFLWDNTAYVLGVTNTDDGRLAKVHAAFTEKHLAVLDGNECPALTALRNFLENWNPEKFLPPFWPEDMKGQNVVFALESEHRTRFLHDYPEAKEIWEKVYAERLGKTSICLVSGKIAPVARLHPSIKGVWGAQSSGASIVSFNQDSFTSYGHDQGDNAPISDAVAARYVGALNEYLKRDNGHCIQIGDASTVFWAEADNAIAGDNDLIVAEKAFGGFWGDDLVPEIDEDKQAGEVGYILSRIRDGSKLKDFKPALAEGVRFYVLGLAPNAARLSVRFYLEDDFGVIAARYQRFLDETAILPGPRHAYPRFWQYLVETAVLKKRENIAPNLAGEWMRAILTGTPYPLTLLSSILIRLRADGDVNALRVAMMRAVLVRNFNLEKEAPVAFDPDNDNKGYLLGRLFAVYEKIQYAAQGGVNSTVKDKFYGAASAQPRKIFSILEKGSANHLAKIRKIGRSEKYYTNIVSGIMDKMSPGDDPYPVALSSLEQALFGLGYYHQRNEFFKTSKNESVSEDVSQ